MANKPIHSIRVGRVEVAIWKNQSETAAWYNFTFQRSYRDDEGDFKNTATFGRDDLPVIAFLTARAFEYVESLA